jgi:hypothetical protein
MTESLQDVDDRPEGAERDDAGEVGPSPLCALPPMPDPVLPPGLAPDRLEAILDGRTKWVNGTVLHYYFFDRPTDGSRVRLSDGTTRFVSWVGSQVQQDVVREAFRKWADVGVGLEFREVRSRLEAEIRIGFMFDFDGSWSALGRDVLTYGPNARTMNFGWDLTTRHGRATALHEIGHALGMPHEHQNPFAGIVWDEEAVYRYFAGPPNRWDRQKTFHNVLRKLSPTTVSGSVWDPTSIMEYGFPPDLIVRPEQFRAGVPSPLSLSPIDMQYVRQWYPQIGGHLPLLEPLRSEPLRLESGDQVDFVVEPPGTRTYTFGAFGAGDAVLVLFEQVDGELRFVTGDDSSGQDRSARLDAKLFHGRTYVLRMRLNYATDSAGASVMYW